MDNIPGRTGERSRKPRVDLDKLKKLSAEVCAHRSVFQAGQSMPRKPTDSHLSGSSRCSGRTQSRLGRSSSLSSEGEVSENGI